jgi:predicted transcriptional regulator of viral defense system
MELIERVEQALPEIARAFNERRPKRVFSVAEIRKIISDERKSWKLPATGQNQIVQAITNKSPLKEVTLDFPYRPAQRYVWGEVTTFELAQSLHETGYFSHQTALHLHGLTTQTPRTIYLNIEQPKKAGGGTLTQAGIDRAFSGSCRKSTNVADHRDLSICILNGANTANLGVTEINTPDNSSRIRVTDTERTLIDATVRSIYAGGISEVAKAFKRARDRVSAKKLAAYLRKLNYTYPYHQSIGFYMQRCGYKQTQIAFIREFEIEFDFYLDYRLKETDYNKEWKLKIPKGF